MNVLMQLRKVCNHPDLFEARDYQTPLRMKFGITLEVPSIVVSEFQYKPMETINYEALKLILLKNENLSKVVYAELLKLFPSKSLASVYQKVVKKERSLCSHDFKIEDNAVYYRKKYADSTVFFKSNTEEAYDVLKHSSSLFNNINYLPEFICPTNIPNLNNDSLQSFREMFNPISSEGRNVISAFKRNINQKLSKKYQVRLEALNNADYASRLDYLFSLPIYGSDLLNLIRLNTFTNIACNYNEIYGFNTDRKLNKAVSSISFNKAYSIFPSLKSKLRIVITEGFYTNWPKDDILQQDEMIQMLGAEGEAVERPKRNFKIIKKSTRPFTKNLTCNFQNSNLKFGDTPLPLSTSAMNKLFFDPLAFYQKAENLMENFRIYLPSTISQGPSLRLSRYNKLHESANHKFSIIHRNLLRIPNVTKYLSLHKIISFPDKNLIKSDSGKLIRLAELLKKIKSNKSKVLIFTQMTRMLDILESFLSLFGYTYVRLDGSTKVEVRQKVVDKFNNDPKIFCFISSTRSGGIGINLTAASSIVFFDTDWNPAMDKQAQDRCHRIGQTRTVNIYRLITTSTIEENIFKKSIQKRELNFYIMENGQFDTKSFDKINFKSIVDEEHLIKREEGEENRGMLMFENLRFENEDEQRNIEELLIKIEDKEDVNAMKNASKEMLYEYEEVNEEQEFINRDEVIV